jgi:CO dehydrogenase/acetyl-CoA synthase beta subunit
LELFDKTIREIKDCVSVMPVRTWQCSGELSWPAGGDRNIVLEGDVAVELGSPRTESASGILWTEDEGIVKDGRICLSGPEIADAPSMSPFGKVVLLQVEGFTEDNAYDRYLELEDVRYSLDLKGYMLRATSQYMREWLRISKWAKTRGLSFDKLGSHLISGYKNKPWVRAVEIIFVTSSADDVRRLKTILEPSARMIGAMNKMATEMNLECAECDYKDVCDESDILKTMRDKLRYKVMEKGSGQWHSR